MSLDAAVQARFSAQILINASNPQLSGGNVIDTVRLANAETDVQAALKVLAGVAYNDSDDTHILYCTEGVLIRLMVMTGQTSYDAWKDWKKSVKYELARVQGRDRIVPSTNSTLQPTTEAPNSKPFADRSVFDGHFRPNSPGGSTGNSRDLSQQ